MQYANDDRIRVTGRDVRIWPFRKEEHLVREVIIPSNIGLLDDTLRLSL